MLEVKNVSYAYKTKKDKTILNNVSATFEEGIFYTIVGPSGAGKTTLLSLLAGLDTAVKRDCPLQWRGHYKKRAELPQKA